jgi:twitching motility protein PilI
MAESAKSLSELRDDPYELLRQMEARSRLGQAASAGGDAESVEWVGIGFLLGNERFLVQRGQVREVMMLPALMTLVPGSKDWVAGLANLRGQLLPIIDLREFLGAGSTEHTRASRVLVAENDELLVGILVDEVYGFRRFSQTEFTSELPDLKLRCERYLDGACVRGADTWGVFSMEKLLAAAEFQQAAA